MVREETQHVLRLLEIANRTDVPVIQIDIDQERANTLGIGNQQVGRLAQAAFAGVKVTAVNKDTGLTHSVPANESGLYVFANLEPGRYDVTAEYPGFKKVVVSNLELKIGDSISRELLMQPGDVILLQETPLESLTRYFTTVWRFDFLGTIIRQKDLTGTSTLNLF